MQEQNYSTQWKDLRMRIATFFVSWIGGFFALATLSSTFKNVGGWFGVLWFIAFFVAGGRWSSFPCPRCGKKFFKPSAWSVNQLIDKCPHCGLQKWS